MCLFAKIVSAFIGPEISLQFILLHILSRVFSCFVANIFFNKAFSLLSLFWWFLSPRKLPYFVYFGGFFPYFIYFGGFCHQEIPLQYSFTHGHVVRTVTKPCVLPQQYCG